MVVGLGISLHSLPLRRRFGPRPQNNTPPPPSSPALPMSPLLLFPEPDPPEPTPPLPPPPPSDAPSNDNGKGSGKNNKKGVNRKPVPKVDNNNEEIKEGGNKGRVKFINSPTLIAENTFFEDDSNIDDKPNESLNENIDNKMENSKDESHKGKGPPNNNNNKGSKKGKEKGKKKADNNNGENPPKPEEKDNKPKEDTLSDTSTKPPTPPLASTIDDEPIIEDLFHEIERDTRLLKEAKEEEAKKKEKEKGTETSASEPENIDGVGGNKKKKKKKKGVGGPPEAPPKDENQPPKPLDERPPLPEIPKDEHSKEPPKDEKGPPNPPNEKPPLPDIPKDEPPKEPSKDELPLPIPDITLAPEPPLPHPADVPPKAPTTTGETSTTGDLESSVAPASTPPTSPPSSRPTTPTAQLPLPAIQIPSLEDGTPSLLTVAFHAINFNRNSLTQPPAFHNSQQELAVINDIERDVTLLPECDKVGIANNVPDLAKDLIRASNELRRVWHESQS